MWDMGQHDKLLFERGDSRGGADGGGGKGDFPEVQTQGVVLAVEDVSERVVGPHELRTEGHKATVPRRPQRLFLDGRQSSQLIQLVFATSRRYSCQTTLFLI